MNFTGTNGGEPYTAQLTLSESGTTLFGDTYEGGIGYDEGVVFGIDTSGNNYKNLLSLNYANGKYPEGALVLSGKVLYGMASVGGTYNLGTIFSVDTDGTASNTLFNFDATNGGNPEGGGLILSGDTLFGMTTEGGTGNYGVIFSYIDNTIGAGINTLHVSVGSINVYPSPSNGLFTISLSHAELISSTPTDQTTITVYNLFGQLVYNESMSLLAGGQVDNLIDLSGQPSAVYLYKVISNNRGLIGEGKLVIQK